MESPENTCPDDAQYIITSDSKQSKQLPAGMYIKLADNMGYMRLRKFPAVLRMHNYAKEDAMKEMYSEILFYHPFKSEQELPADDVDECIELFSEMDPGEELKPVDHQKSKIQLKSIPL